MHTNLHICAILCMFTLLFYTTSHIRIFTLKVVAVPTGHPKFLLTVRLKSLKGSESLAERH